MIGLFGTHGVMSQVGHPDSKMTLDVYAQLEQRVNRSHGTSFDRLMRKAREQISGYTLDPPNTHADNGLGLGDEKATSRKTPATRPIQRRTGGPQKPKNPTVQPRTLMPARHGSMTRPRARPPATLIRTPS